MKQSKSAIKTISLSYVNFIHVLGIKNPATK